MKPYGTYTAHEGEVYRDGIVHSLPTMEALQAAFSADPNAYAKALAEELGAAIREAKSYSKTEAA